MSGERERSLSHPCRGKASRQDATLLAASGLHPPIQSRAPSALPRTPRRAHEVHRGSLGATDWRSLHTESCVAGGGQTQSMGLRGALGAVWSEQKGQLSPRGAAGCQCRSGLSEEGPAWPRPLGLPLADKSGSPHAVCHPEALGARNRSDHHEARFPPFGSFQPLGMGRSPHPRPLSPRHGHSVQGLGKAKIQLAQLSEPRFLFGAHFST